MLKQLQHHGVRLKKGKCFFQWDAVEYLDHRVNATGLHTTRQKVEAIQLAPAPKDQNQLCSFWGLLQEN